MISFKESAENWEEAIKIASQPLLEQQFIEKEYIDTMISNVKEFGPYIVMVPGFAMPHARPENGVNKLGVSLLILGKETLFNDEKAASVFLVLAATDPESHLALLSELSSLLSNEENVARLAAARSESEVFTILKEESK
ncbi:PTS sugar transporter subunit IIA [Mesobacillus zeae]|uniref:Ascorbate-specific PTS system EIIA component n=2 Tax=Mesobacillus zeae TaxID=1917180 RepID=A0A398B423_9BACI|nr:PTS sugar transporter subunit IIA [Mesobacillus zeae]